jgi:hypothetical protein
MARELKPHQSQALMKLRNGSILCGGVGSGKSFVAVSYYKQFQSNRPVYVITTAKKRDSGDWPAEFAYAAIGGVVVDSWNNINKYARVTGAFFIFDEQRLVGSGSWVKSFMAISSKNSWLLLSATPGDTWLEYAPVFIANQFFKNRTDFKAKHVVYKPYMKFPVIDHYVDEWKLKKFRDEILVEMPYERHTTRHLIKISVEHNRSLIKTAIKTRMNPYLDEPMKNASDLPRIMRRIVNSDLSRLEEVKKVLKRHPKLIVFYNFDYELAILRTLEGVQIAEWNGHKHEEIPDSEAWVYLVQYTAGAEGWECVTTNAMFFWSQTYSFKVFEQAMGRIDRLHTKYFDLFYYLPLSSAWIDLAIRKALEQKRDFNEREMSELS